MHLPTSFRARLQASFLARIAIGTTLLAAGPAAAKEVINPFGRTAETLRALEENRARQVEAAKSWSTFHDFTFTDRADESGIRFDHHPVDDAAKNYMAVHYDHGNGIAAADVDGDGRTDIYLVDQLGSSDVGPTNPFYRVQKLYYAWQDANGDKTVQEALDTAVARSNEIMARFAQTYAGMSFP